MGAVTLFTSCSSDGNGKDRCCCEKVEASAPKSVISREGTVASNAASPNLIQVVSSPRATAAASIASRRNERLRTLAAAGKEAPDEEDPGEGEEDDELPKKVFVRPPKSAASLTWKAQTSPRATQMSPRATQMASPRSTARHMTASPRSAFGYRAPDAAMIEAARELENPGLEGFEAPASEGLNARATEVARARATRAPRVQANIQHEDSDDEEKQKENSEANRVPFYNELMAQDYDHVLLIACAVGDAKTVQMAIDHEALPTVKDKHGYQAGFHAAMSGSMETLDVILNHDYHDIYGNYFDRVVCHNQMTPLMTFIRHGLSHIYEYLVHERGCELRLLGQRFAVDDESRLEPGKSAKGEEGLDAPLDKWLLLVPEMCHRDQVPEPHELMMPHRKLKVTKPITSEKEFEVQRSNRIQARNFFRNKFGAAAARTSVREAAKVKRHAITAGFNKKDLASLKSCIGHTVNEPLQVPDFDEEDGEGEVWDNTGDDFLDERFVKEYIPLFRRSIFWHLGGQRVRELLRVVKVEVKPKGSVLFREPSPLDALHVLKSGQVTLASKERKDREVLTVTEHGKTERSIIKVLDQRAFMDYQSVHKATAVVTSDEATVFVFSQADVAEHCGIADMKMIVHDSLSCHIMQLVPLLRVGFTPTEKPLVAQKLKYEEYPMGHVMIQRGQRTNHVVVVQKGKVRIQEENKSRTINISSDRDNWKPGERWQPYFMLGVRLLVFDIPSTATVDIEDGTAESWVLEPRYIDSVLMDGNLLLYMQIATYVLFIYRVVLFSKLKMTDLRLRKLVMISERMEYWCEEDIIVQGDMGDSMYLLVEGIVGVRIRDKEVATLVADMDHDKVHYFGELAILEHSKRGASVRVKSASATAIKIDMSGIEEAFGSLEALLAEQGMDTSMVLQIAQKKIQGHLEKDTIEEDVCASAPVKGNRNFKPLEGLKTEKQKKNNKKEPQAAQAQKKLSTAPQAQKKTPTPPDAKAASEAPTPEAKKKKQSSWFGKAK